MENRDEIIGTIVKLFSGAKVKVTGKCHDENSDMFDYEGIDENDKKCWIRNTAISGLNCTSMDREPRV